MRKSNPEAVRPFKVPLVPVVPLLGVLVCGFMIFGLGFENWSRLLIWLLVGFDIYILYSLRNSLLADKTTEVRKSKFVSMIGLVTAITLIVLTFLVYQNPGQLIASSYVTKPIDGYFKFIMNFSGANIIWYVINYLTKKEK